MKRFRLALLALVLCTTPVAAQNTRVVASCSGVNMNWSPNDLGRPLLVDTSGTLCSYGSSGGSGTSPLSPSQHNLPVTSATALTVPSGALVAVVCVRVANVNYETDGTTTPTTSVGMQLLIGQCVQLVGATTLANFRAIQQSAGATLDVSYFR